jgi:hypothetical protein
VNGSAIELIAGVVSALGVIASGVSLFVKILKRGSILAEEIVVLLFLVLAAGALIFLLMHVSKAGS